MQTIPADSLVLELLQIDTSWYNFPVLPVTDPRTRQRSHYCSLTSLMLARRAQDVHLSVTIAEVPPLQFQLSGAVLLGQEHVKSWLEQRQKHTAVSVRLKVVTHSGACNDLQYVGITGNTF